MSEKERGGKRLNRGDDATDTQTGQTIIGDGGVQTGDDGQRKLEGVLRALLNQRRRYTLYFLQENEVSDLDELTKHVAAMEQGADPVAESVQIDQVRTSLVHSDLPKLAENGLVEFDRRSEAVRYSRPPELLDKMLRLCANFDDPAVR
ncbi:hypothetical protein Htur_4766 (plasmid) [Haloterrigena turkmenica DSM 5511]|uniref:DUF7344 domain-containing protein n=1 Tax=Haloterrigena turkmenica (strain ATCC 51198 / DSM 5511 / JCM 9101 / NCIMB 13204 / VKM B-1734 / 4k) TaxID=543526 RepID=D2S2E1_HALTV|nr:hypothetical protein [Haloterrigena turkmenica]ADB63538.1 hypothetical protein Htur_4766 [Haloterrigena turkmenica DSM 5511]